MSIWLACEKVRWIIDSRLIRLIILLSSSTCICSRYFIVNKGHFIFNVTITFYNIIQQRSLWKIKQNYAIWDLNGNDIDRMICKIILSHAIEYIQFWNYLSILSNKWNVQFIKNSYACISLIMLFSPCRDGKNVSTSSGGYGNHNCHSDITLCCCTK